MASRGRAHESTGTRLTGHAIVERTFATRKYESCKINLMKPFYLDESDYEQECLKLIDVIDTLKAMIQKRWG
jgi:hypothetical protein